MSPLNINILSNEFVRPSSPTQEPFKKYHLSMLDQSFPRFFIPIVLYYDHPHQTTSGSATHLQISSRLKESFSQTLTMFYPLAGRFNKQDNSIDCNDVGVRYLEAKVDSIITNVINCHEPQVSDQLIPFMENGQEDILAIQVNYFNCGGIAIGAYVPHTIVDGASYFSFMTSWAAISARKHDITLKPSFVSSSLFPPIPKEKHEYSPLSESEEDSKERLVTRRFVFDARQITSIREKAARIIDHHEDMMAYQPTRVELVSTFIWKYATVDKPGKQYIAAHSVNLRTRMVPPLSEHAIGNLIVLAYADCCHEDSNDLAIMARKLRDGIRSIDDGYIRRLRGDEGYAMMMKNWEKMSKLITNGEMNFFIFSSWCRFPVYDIDFGTGKPVWASPGSLNVKNSAVLLDSKCGDGVEAWVTMNEEEMTRFHHAYVREVYV